MPFFFSRSSKAFGSAFVSFVGTALSAATATSLKVLRLLPSSHRLLPFLYAYCITATTTTTRKNNEEKKIRLK